MKCEICGSELVPDVIGDRVMGFYCESCDSPRTKQGREVE